MNKVAIGKEVKFVTPGSTLAKGLIVGHQRYAIFWFLYKVAVNVKYPAQSKRHEEGSTYGHYYSYDLPAIESYVQKEVWLVKPSDIIAVNNSDKPQT